VKVSANFVLSVGLAVAAAAQTTNDAARRIQSLVAVKEKGGVRIEVDLTSPVTPHLRFATGPDRLVLELPDAVPGAERAPIAVNENGVKSVRMEVDERARPSVTRVVVALSEARPYALATDGNKIILTVLASVEATARKERNGPAAAASAPLVGRFHKKREAHTDSNSGSAQSMVVTAPPSLPPISFPEAQSSATASASRASSSGNAASEQGAVASAAQGSGFPPQTVAAKQPAAQTSAAVPTDSGQLAGDGGASWEAQSGLPVQAGAQSASGAGSGNPSMAALQQANPDIRIAFRVKYVAEGAAYLEGGRNDGLAEGMKLVVKAIDPSSKPTASSTEDAQPIADLEVASVALSSAVSEIHNPTRPVRVGDWAYLSSEDTQALIVQRSLSATRKYPVVLAFSDGDTLDDEARVVIPRPPLPEVNRARGRIGFDYSGIASHGAGGGLGSNAGLMIRTDITRINGTYWNLSGFWRGRLSQRSSSGQSTLQDLINRTYTLSLTYDNPNSNWVAGFGRLYLPWAPSLDSIDGGYVGRKIRKGVTAGIFAGTSPDPTSWSYSPDRRMGGAFVNVEGGSFDHVRYTSTSGVGIGMLKWNIDRPFVFFENGIFFKRYVSIYHSLQADSPSGNAAVAAPGAGIRRSFLTVRLQPTPRVEFDLNHTYFRDIPTFDPQLIGTGLLDKYLFQGFSGGVRVQVMKDVWAYTTLGRSSRSGDASASWNQLYGMTVGRLPWLDVRSDAHYSKFNSSFGGGSYESVSFSRNLRETLRWEVLGGRLTFASPTSHDTSHFVTGNVEAALGPHYFAQTGYTWTRGGVQNYDQWIFTFGYRFDSRSSRK
jgi:hypothetical protein